MTATSAMVLLVPVAATIVAQVGIGAGSSDPVVELARSLLSLGVGGLLARVFYDQWQKEIKKRELAEARERKLLLSLVSGDHALPPDVGRVTEDDITQS